MRLLQLALQTAGTARGPTRCRLHVTPAACAGQQPSRSAGVFRTAGASRHKGAGGGEASNVMVTPTWNMRWRLLLPGASGPRL